MRNRTIAQSYVMLAAGAILGFIRPGTAQELPPYPDWSGQWRIHTDSQTPLSGQWDPTKPGGPAQQAPLTPEYQARYEANLADQAAGGQGDDRRGYCLPSGMPRVMSATYPMEVIITPKTTYILTDNSSPRRIFTDGVPWPREIEPSFEGLQSGDGATLTQRDGTRRSRLRRAVLRDLVHLRPAVSACTMTTRL